MAGESFHVRLKPDPPIIIRTSMSVNDRLEVSEDFLEHGVYRRVSSNLISQLKSEQSRLSEVIARAPEPVAAEARDKSRRIDTIIAIASTCPTASEKDLGNPPVPDLSHY